MRVPNVSEAFRYYYTWDTFTPVAPNAWLGSAPRLDSLDEGTTAARVADDGDELGAAVTVSFPPFTMSSAAKVTLTVQMRVYGDDYDGVLVFLSNEGEFSDDFAYAEFEVLESQGWVTLTHTFPNDWRLTDLAARAAAGTLIAGVYPGFIPDGESYYHEISAIVLDVGGRPLRWRQRNDGLGGSSPRAARGVASQQGSSRHRGYL